MVGIFPDDQSVLRLVGAVLIEVHDDWQTTDRRYLSEGSMKLIGQQPKEITTTEETPALHAAYPGRESDPTQVELLNSAT